MAFSYLQDRELPMFSPSLEFICRILPLGAALPDMTVLKYGGLVGVPTRPVVEMLTCADIFQQVLPFRAVS